MSDETTSAVTPHAIVSIPDTSPTIHISDVPTLPTSVGTAPTVDLPGALHAEIRSLLGVMEGRLDTVEAGVMNDLRKTLDRVTEAFKAETIKEFHEFQVKYTKEKAEDLHKLRQLLGMNGIEEPRHES